MSKKNKSIVNEYSLSDKDKKIYDKLDKEIDYNSKILEVGCGTGQLTNFLARYSVTPRFVLPKTSLLLIGQLIKPTIFFSFTNLIPRLREFKIYFLFPLAVFLKAFLNLNGTL